MKKEEATVKHQQGASRTKRVVVKVMLMQTVPINLGMYLYINIAFSIS